MVLAGSVAHDDGLFCRKMLSFSSCNGEVPEAWAPRMQTLDARVNLAGSSGSALERAETQRRWDDAAAAAEQKKL